MPTPTPPSPYEFCHPTDAWEIVRVRSSDQAEVRGWAIPAFIHNLSWHLVAVEAYADGVVECWGYVDLPLFHRKIAEGWVAARPPVGAAISVFLLGQATVAEAEWYMAGSTIADRVEEAITDLNPSLANLQDLGGDATEPVGRIRRHKISDRHGKPVRISNGDSAAIPGVPLPVFVAEPGRPVRLTEWFIFADGQTRFGFGANASPLLPLAEAETWFADGRARTGVADGTLVTVDGGLGRFRVGEGFWHVEPDERVREARDHHEQLTGSLGAIRLCIAAHRVYEASPDEAHREALRQAYEAVPQHLRIFCGDMDEKDYPIQLILDEKPDAQKN